MSIKKMIPIAVLCLGTLSFGQVSAASCKKLDNKKAEAAIAKKLNGYKGTSLASLKGIKTVSNDSRFAYLVVNSENFMGGVVDGDATIECMDGKWMLVSIHYGAPGANYDIGNIIEEIK